MDIKGKGPDGASPIASPPNESGNVSKGVGVPKGGSASTSGYCTYEGNKANGVPGSQRSAPDGGHGFSLDERMTKWGGGNIDTGFARRDLPDRSNVLTANSQASDMTRSKPKLLDQGKRAPASE